MSQVYKIDGLEEVYTALKRLPSKLGAKILLDANRDILKNILMSPLKSNLHFSAKTKRAIKVVPARGVTGGVFLGVSSDAFYLRFLQGGTEPRYTRTDEKSRKLSKRYKKVGRLGASQKHFRGSIQARETGVVSTIDERTNDVLREVSENYGDRVVSAITKHLKKYETRKI